METAATIMEISADREQTVADTEALEPDVVDPPRTEENVAAIRTGNQGSGCLFSISSRRIEKPGSRME